METGVPNSFIPHDATTPTATRRYDSANGAVDLLMLLAIVIVSVSGILGGGCFLYLNYLNSESTQMQAQIKKAEAAFDSQTVNTLTRLDSRMNSASSLLSAHIAPSAFFAALDQTTLTTVTFQSLSFTDDPGGKLMLTMAGIARDINSVALQADLFGKSGVISNAIFSGIAQQPDGVHFTVIGSVDPAKINYGTVIAGETPQGVNPLPAASSASTSPSTSALPSFRQ